MTSGNGIKGLPNEITEVWLENWISRSADIKKDDVTYTSNGHAYRLLIVRCEGMAGAKQIVEYVYKELSSLQTNKVTLEDLLYECGNVLNWKLVESSSGVIQAILTGNTIIYIPEEAVFFQVDTASVPQRKPEESSTESSIKGPRDGFTEELTTNIALIRKRLKTTSLCNESFTIGSRSQTKVSMLYLEDIAQPTIIAEAKSRLNNINIDVLTSSGTLEEALGDQPRSLFPLVDYIGRPDYAVECISRGRFVILVDGSPMALIAPSNLWEILKSPEDAYFPYYLVSFERILRLVGLAISLLLPGFYVALCSYDTDQIPIPLLATIVNSRFGIPFPVPMEAFLMLGMFELFREAGIRLPKAIGQIVAVVGGLIIGDAAIRAGLTSPTMLVVSSTCAVATFTLVNQSLTGTVSLFRTFILLLASLLGMFGFLIGLIGTIVYVSTLTSFQVPYLSPIAPIHKKEIIKALFALPKMAYKNRPKILETIDTSRQESDPK